MHSILRKSLAMAVLVLAISLATTTTLAKGGGHLWFYSQDPDTLPGPQPLPNPQDYDPNWIGADADPWLEESIVIPPDSDWETPFSIWLACAQFESLDTMLVVSINTAASVGIDTITITTPEGTFPITSWTPHPGTPGWAPGCLAPHGVFNSAEFYGYYLVPVGNLYSPPGSPYAIEIEVEIVLNDGAPEGMKIHFDAYGYTDPGYPEGACIFSPYSHDLTIVPELGTILLAAASFSALALYALKRRKYSP